MRKVVKAYCLDWHTGSSNAFIDLLVEPLKDQFDIRLTSWNGKDIKSSNYNELVIFCMLPPTDEIMRTHEKVIWIPMWDQAQGYDQQWWDQLPKHLKIISFSGVVSDKAKSAGLNTIDVRYAVDPNSVKPASWNNGVVISYWNRVGLVGLDLLKELCRLTDAKKLIFRPTLDPRVEKHMYYELPNHIGDCEVVTINPKTKEEYLKLTTESNVLIAPRKAEGVGLIFLEAMARGCAVIAYDAPTMNEYIKSEHNGILIDGNRLNTISRIKRKLYPNSSPFLLDDGVNIANLADFDYSRIGDEALNTSTEIYKKWLSSRDKLTKFMQTSM